MLNNKTSVHTQMEELEDPHGEKTGTEGQISTTESASRNKNHLIRLRWIEETTTPRPTVDVTDMPCASKDSLKIVDQLPVQKRIVLSPAKRKDEHDKPDSRPNDQDKSDEMLNLKGPKLKPETKNVQQESKTV